MAAALFLVVAACGSSGGAGNSASNNVADAPEPLPSDAELARDAELANEAAADEAADMNNFGGSAVEMDLANSR
jgi:hypothetical protein